MLAILGLSLLGARPATAWGQRISAPQGWSARVDTRGAVDAFGTVTLTGTVVCGAGGDVGVQVHLRQDAGAAGRIDADGYARLWCDRAGQRVSWSVTIFSPNAPFASGRGSAFARLGLPVDSVPPTTLAETPFRPVALADEG